MLGQEKVGKTYSHEVAVLLVQKPFELVGNA